MYNIIPLCVAVQEHVCVCPYIYTLLALDHTVLTNKCVDLELYPAVHVDVEIYL